jgi:hypothetical protein
MAKGPKAAVASSDVPILKAKVESSRVFWQTNVQLRQLVGRGLT